MATLHATPVRFGAASWLLPVRATVVTVAGLGLLLLLVAIDLSVGDFPVPLGDVVRTLLGGGDAGQRFIVMELRLPQTMAAVAVGAALGLAGALTQTLARNPLASPDILGVTEGAAFAAVLVIVASGASGYGGGLVTGRLQELGLPLAAFTGAMVTAALLYLFSWRRGLDVQRLVLVGIGLGATLTAATSYLLVNSRIQDDPALPSNVKTQVAAATDEGIPIVTTEQAHQALLDAGLKPAEADAVTEDYGNAELDALKTSMLAVAFLAVLSFWFTRRLPGRPEEAA